MSSRLRSIVACTLAAASIGTTAHAEPTASERTLARSLFEEGRRLTQQGSFGEACPKLEDSQRLDPGMGTLFNLADCWEHVGRLASAWNAYLEVADQAKKTGQVERERVARARAMAVDPRVPRLVIVVKEASDLSLRIDGAEVRRASLDTPFPVDPGEHVLEATAPGKRAYATKVTVATGTATVEITMLEPEERPAPPPSPPPPPSERPREAALPQASTVSWQRPAAIVSAGTGVVALGAGAFFGLRASSTWDSGKTHCTGSTCDEEGRAAFESARSDARLSNITIIAGAALVAAGVVLWLTAPSSSTRVGVAGNGLLVAGVLP